MSIANYSVVGRILAEVRQTGLPGELATVERAADAQQAFALHRTAHIHQPPFATSFHFWAYALQGFLDERGRPDLFDAMATHALCKVVSGSEVAPQLEALAARLSQGSSLLDAAGFRLGYRMIDQEVMVSWVCERDSDGRSLRDGEWVAVFWVDLDWLTSAEPYDPDLLEPQPV